MIASNIVSSGTSFAPASIITTFFCDPATVSSRVLSWRCLKSGLMMILPSTSPTWTPAIGPFHGISEIESAIEAPSIAATSGSQSGSTERMSRLIATSLRRSFGKSGRIGLSMTLEARIDLSVGLPSLLL